MLTSHLMKEVEELSDSIYVMRAGQVIARGSPSEIISMAGRVVEAVLRREDVTPELSKFVVRDDGETVLL
ncbi:MAG: ABC transporter ATP-binding protein, partial [Acidilobus sp.]